jgi:hypothetical protein
MDELKPTELTGFADLEPICPIKLENAENVLRDVNGEDRKRMEHRHRLP